MSKATPSVFGVPPEEEKRGILEWLDRHLSQPEAEVYIGDTWSRTTGTRVTIAIIRQNVASARWRLHSTETTPDSREFRSASIPQTAEEPQSRPVSSESDSEDTQTRAEYVVGHLIDALHMAVGMTFVTPSAPDSAGSPHE